jgi:hypothetical protein
MKNMIISTFENDSCFEEYFGIANSVFFIKLFFLIKGQNHEIVSTKKMYRLDHIKQKRENLDEEHDH